MTRVKYDRPTLRQTVCRGAHGTCGSREYMATYDKHTVTEKVWRCTNCHAETPRLTGRRNRVQEVNDLLKRLGRSERLTAGRGYYYWRSGNWPSVHVYRANDMPLEWWFDEVKRNLNAEIATR